MTTVRPLPDHQHLEAQLEAELFKRVASVGGMAIKMIPTTKGLPDRLVLLPGGRMYLIELKTEDGSLSKLQVHWHQQMARVGIHVYVLVGKAGILNWLRDRLDDAYYEDTPKKRPGPKPRAR